MIYKQFQPDKLLTNFVKNYWWFENSTTKQLDFTILPDGCFDLIVSFDNYKQEEISLAGLWIKQVEVSIEPNRQLFGIRIKLLAVDYILQQNISAFCDSEQIKENDFWNLDKALFTDLESETEKLYKVMLSILGIHKGIAAESKIYSTYYTKQTEKKRLNNIHNKYFGQTDKLIVILKTDLVFL